MDSEQLTRRQLEIIQTALSPALSFLSRMQIRMDATHFPPTDKLRMSTAAAQQAMQRLLMDLHYLDCRSGVAHARKQPLQDDRNDLDDRRRIR